MARHWGNISCGVVELSRGNGGSECLAYAWDLETNYRDEKRFYVKHWRDTKNGGYALTDERDIYELIANMGARRKRACILAVIPGDVQEAAVEQAELTLKTSIEIDEDLISTTLAKFEELGVSREQIEARLQRRFSAETISAGHILTLRKIYRSIRDGMSTAADWFDPVEKKIEEAKASAKDKMNKMASKPKRKPKPEPKAQPEPEPEPEQEPEPVADDPKPTSNEAAGLFGDDD
jgi:hypothetical protein